MGLYSEVMTGSSKAGKDDTDMHMIADINSLKEILSTYTITYDLLKQNASPAMAPALEALNVEMTKYINDIAITLRNATSEYEKQGLSTGVVNSRNELSQKIYTFDEILRKTAAGTWTEKSE